MFLGPGRGGARAGSRDVKCYNCGRFGHPGRECRSAPQGRGGRDRSPPPRGGRGGR